MPALACVKCKKFFRMKKSGVPIEEGMPKPDGDWGPYKLWMADLYECPECGVQIIAGFGSPYNWPLAEHYQPKYAETRSKYPPLITVNDCGGAKP